MGRDGIARFPRRVLVSRFMLDDVVDRSVYKGKIWVNLVKGSSYFLALTRSSELNIGHSDPTRKYIGCCYLLPCLCQWRPGQQVTCIHDRILIQRRQHNSLVSGLVDNFKDSRVYYRRIDRERRGRRVRCLSWLCVSCPRWILIVRRSVLFLANIFYSSHKHNVQIRVIYAILTEDLSF